MRKRKTTKVRRRSRPSVLQVRVMSPRIAWFGFLRYLGHFTKLAVLLAVLGGLGFGIWQGVRHAFYQNPDFQLRVIKLNPNSVIDEAGVAATAGIDIAGAPSLFDIDVSKAAQSLRALPEIREARVERHLPDTLVVHVVGRLPKAWISCPEAGLTGEREAGSMLVDHSGVAYPCPPRQLEIARGLPVVRLPGTPDLEIRAGEEVLHPELEHCLALLDAARMADREAVKWIETIYKCNEWSLRLVTRQGTHATFGLGEHKRQMESLRAALDHAGEKGYLIDTINLIPKYNIPITLQGEDAPPRAIPVVLESPEEAAGVRRARDMSTLLRRD